VLHRGLALAFSQWTESVLEQVALKARLQAVFSKMRKRRTLRAFNAWADLWAAKAQRLEHQAHLVWRLKVGAISLSSDTSSCACMDLWTRADLCSRRDALRNALREVAAAAEAASQNAGVLWAFNSWRAQCTGVRKQTLELGSGPLKGRMSSAAAEGGERATGLAAEARKREMNAYKAVRFWTNLVMARALRHWRGVLRPIETFEDLRDRQQRLDARLAVGGVGAVLSIEKRAAAVTASVATNRRYALLLHKAATRMRERQLAAAYDGWVLWMQRLRYEAQREQMARLDTRARRVLLRPLELLLRGRRDRALEAVTGFPVNRKPQHSEALCRSVSDGERVYATLAGDGTCSSSAVEQAQHCATDMLCAELEWLQAAAQDVHKKEMDLKGSLLKQMVRFRSPFAWGVCIGFSPLTADALMSRAMQSGGGASELRGGHTCEAGGGSERADAHAVVRWRVSRCRAARAELAVHAARPP
jgi:hypothetical protein